MKGFLRGAAWISVCLTGGMLVFAEFCNMAGWYFNPIWVFYGVGLLSWLAVGLVTLAFFGAVFALLSWEFRVWLAAKFHIWANVLRSFGAEP